MVSAEDIPPGGEGQIKVAYKTGKKFGEKSQTITVSTNDPKNKTVRLTVIADIQAKLVVSPSRINFGKLKKGVQSSEKYVSLSGTEKAISKIVSVSTKNSHIKAEVVPSEAEDNKPDQKIKVVVLPDMKVGRFNDWVTVNTDHEENKTLKFQVYGEVVGDITVIPPYLSFGIFRKGGKYDKTLRLKAAPGVIFKVLDVQSTNPDLVPRVIPIKEGTEYLVKVTLKESFDTRLLAGKVIIKTDDQEQQTIEVKVTGRAFIEKTLNKTDSEGSWEMNKDKKLSTAIKKEASPKNQED